MGSQLTGVILAGGASSRMGTDKAHLAWGSRTLIAHVIETLRPVVNEVIVAVKDARKFCGLNAKVVEDLVPDAHALGGLYTGLVLASHERCLACACDAPFLNPRLVRFLVEQAVGYDLVIPRTAHGLQPLHAVYAKSALPAIEQQLHRQQWDLCALVPKVRAKIIEPALMAPYDPEGLSCFNLNTPEDYAQACRVRRGRW